MSPRPVPSGASFRRFRAFSRVSARSLAGLLAALATAVLAAPAAAAPAKKNGTIIVNSPVLGATVYVDGEEVGTIPVDPFELRFGNHVVKVVRKGLIDF